MPTSIDQHLTKQKHFKKYSLKMRFRHAIIFDMVLSSEEITMILTSHLKFSCEPSPPSEVASQICIGNYFGSGCHSNTWGTALSEDLDLVFLEQPMSQQLG